MTDHLDRRNLQVRCLENAIVVPGGRFGGGIVHDGHYLQEAMMHRGWHTEKNLQLPTDVVEEKGAVVFLGEFYSCWGHCLTDGLKFAWAFLPSELEKWIKEDVMFVYVTDWPDEKLYGNFIRLWELVGVKREQMIRIERPTRFERVYLPDESYYLDPEQHARFYTAEYKRTIDYMRSQVVSRPVRPTRDIFFSRTQWQTTKPDFGERQLEAVIAQATHCECVSPEKLTIEEMIRLQSECKRLITTEGSAAHNSVFLPERAELVILTKADYNNGYQPPINQMRKLKVHKIKAHASRFFEYPNEPWRGPFFLCVTTELANYLGTKPSFSKMEYVKYLIFALYRKQKRTLSRILHALHVLHG